MIRPLPLKLENGMFLFLKCLNDEPYLDLVEFIFQLKVKKVAHLFVKNAKLDPTTKVQAGHPATFGMA